MAWWMWVLLIIYLLFACIVGISAVDKNLGLSPAVYYGVTWPLQVIRMVLIELFKRKPKPLGLDRDWVGGSNQLMHRKLPIRIFDNAGKGWRYVIGRHSAELKSADVDYVRLEYCKAAALEDYADWELNQSKEMAR
jgi:hypothetical protein